MFPKIGSLGVGPPASHSITVPPLLVSMYTCMMVPVALFNTDRMFSWALVQSLLDLPLCHEYIITFICTLPKQNCKQKRTNFVSKFYIYLQKNLTYGNYNE